MHDGRKTARICRPFTYLESADGTSETRVDAAELLMLTLTRCLFSTSLLHSQQQPELKDSDSGNDIQPSLAAAPSVYLATAKWLGEKVPFLFQTRVAKLFQGSRAV